MKELTDKQREILYNLVQAEIEVTAGGVEDGHDADTLQYLIDLGDLAEVL